MPVSLAEFVQGIDASGILDLAELQDYLRASPADAASLAARLVADGRLTTYQAKQASSGHAARLVIGPDIIQSEVGRGGMGCVYRAEHRGDRRIVALKIIDPPTLRDRGAVRRFEREFRAAAALDHPHIVGAIECGEAHGTHYLVMHFVEGRTLAQLVEETGPQPIDDVVEWMRQAATGLAHAHERGVIHRDIKPANLMLDTERRVRILDLGLARLDDGDAVREQLTVTGQVLGTVDFMAPEQALDTRRADVRSDIYSLGATLWYLATARPLFAGETAVARVIAHQKADRPSLAAGCPGVGGPLDETFQRMVARRPEDRFASMHELLDALDRSAASGRHGRPTEGGATAGGTGIGGRFFDTRAVRLGGAILALVGLVAVVVVSMPSPADPSPGAAAVLAPDSVAPLRPVAAWPADAAPTDAVAPLDAAAARRRQEAWAAHLGIALQPRSPTGIDLVVIPPGRFAMGESPVPVVVTITRPFLLGRTEVTQAQWHAVMGRRGPDESPANPPGDDNPMNHVSWEDAQDFCRRLTQRERVAGWLRADQGYRLPTEAEWEYACRAGTTTAFSFGDDPSLLSDHGWWGGGWDDRRKEFVHGTGEGNCRREMFAHPVGLKQPNAWGLCDMHGNLWEWCADWYDGLPAGPLLDPVGPATGTLRVRKGGSWSHPAPRAHAASRLKDLPTTRVGYIGFRVALDP
jgi:formylglycine-generating enzyme required for sulfatase activity/predicted Ser/Thr protein kinase